MPFQVTIKPSNHQFTVQDSETVLEAALRDGFMLPYSCKDGACGSCKGRILEGQVTHKAHSDTALTPQDLADGKALYCSAFPQTDLVIEAREIGAAKDIQVKTMPCRVQSIDKRGDVAILKVSLPANERLVFLAGQYVDFLLKEGKRRSFSLANPPHLNDHLELHIRHVPGGSFSDYVFHTMKEREILRFQGPLGSFFLREDSDKPILFIATGTGIAPIKGIIEYAIQRQIDRPMVLYWGNRSLREMYLPELPASWAQSLPRFEFIPVLSEPKAEDGWAGRTGLVHQAVLDDFADLSGYEVYACGAPVMVEAAHRSLMAERGLPEDAFFSDAFFTAPELHRA